MFSYGTAPLALADESAAATTPPAAAETELAAAPSSDWTPYARFKIPGGLSRAQAMNSVLYSLTTQHWRVTARSENAVTAMLVHRDWNVTVEAVCHDGEVELRHRSLRSGRPAVNKGWLERIRVEAESRFKVEQQRGPAPAPATVAADK